MQGLIIYAGPSRLDNTPIVAILTGLGRPSVNEKTGDMPQLWVVPDSGEDPFAAKKSGGDAAVCGDCPLRDGRCYVNLLRGPLAIYRTYKAGKYDDGRDYSPAQIRDACTTKQGRRRAIRLGAYGDPAALPLPVVQRLVSASPVHTGYTHQWRRFPELAPYVMASVDSPAERDEAQAAGWRTFRTVGPGEDAASTLSPSERWCPAAPEGGASRTRSPCGLCGGGLRGPSFAILAHGGAVSAGIWRAQARRAGLLTGNTTTP